MRAGTNIVDLRKVSPVGEVAIQYWVVRAGQKVQRNFEKNFRDYVGSSIEAFFDQAISEVIPTIILINKIKIDFNMWSDLTISSSRIAGCRRIWKRHTKPRRIAPNWLRSRVMLLPQLAAHQVALCVEGACRGLSGIVRQSGRLVYEHARHFTSPECAATKSHKRSRRPREEDGVMKSWFT